MEAKSLVALMALSSLGGNGNGSMNLREKAIDTNRPNGWYYITSGKQDSLSAEPIVTTKDFASISATNKLNTFITLLFRLLFDLYF